MLAALSARCAALAPRLRGARRLAALTRASSPFDEDFLLPDARGDGGRDAGRDGGRDAGRDGGRDAGRTEGRVDFRERQGRGRDAQKCYKCGEPGHLARDCTSDSGGGNFQQTRVFVANLEQDVQWFDLKDYFRDAGYNVVFASVSAHADGTSKGCGVVQLGSAQECDKAIRDLNGRDLNGLPLAVREDRQERTRRGKESTRAQERGPSRGTSGKEWSAGDRDVFSDRRGAFDRDGGLLPWAGADDAELPAEVLALLADRDAARDGRDFATADALRDGIRDDFGLRIDDRNRRCAPQRQAYSQSAPPARGRDERNGGLLAWTGADEAPLPAEVLALLADRDAARDGRDFATADAVRDDIRDKFGLHLDDTNRVCSHPGTRHPLRATVRAASDDVVVAPPAATVQAASDDAVVAALAGDVSFMDAPVEDSAFAAVEIDMDSILARHGDALRHALAEDNALADAGADAAPAGSSEDRGALQALRVPELKDRCRERGLKVGGTKAVLVDRLLGIE